MDKKKPSKKSRTGKAAANTSSSKVLRVVLPRETYESYEQVARDEHITVAQVVARVAIEFVDIERNASKQRRAVLEGSRDDLLFSLRRNRRRVEAYAAEGGEALPDPAAGWYADIVAQLFGFEQEEATEFFVNSIENTSLVNDQGFLFVETNRPDCRAYECYAETESVASFRSGDWPTDIECRSGSVTLAFTGKQFNDVPVVVEFEPSQRFGVPPKAECTLKLRGRTTISLKSYDSAIEAGTAAIDFERIASLVADLEKRDALESLPGLTRKGLLIRLDDRS